MSKLLDDRVRILRTHPAGAATPRVLECYPLRETAAPKEGKHNGASFGDRRCRGKRKWSSEEPVPWPNMFWLACPDTVRRVGRLEHLGYVKRFQERLRADPALVAEFEANHRAYGARRWALLDAEDRAWCEERGYAPVLRDTGVGGIRCVTQVRCLHVHLAHELAEGDNSNVVGRWVREALERGEDQAAWKFSCEVPQPNKVCEPVPRAAGGGPEQASGGGVEAVRSWWRGTLLARCLMCRQSTKPTRVV